MLTPNIQGPSELNACQTHLLVVSFLAVFASCLRIRFVVVDLIVAGGFAAVSLLQGLTAD